MKELFKNWIEALQYRPFRWLVITELLALIANGLLFLPIYDWVEVRPGFALQDPLLAAITPGDYSIPIFMIAYGMLVYAAIRSVSEPRIFAEYVGAYVLMLWARMATLLLVPLHPPEGLVPLSDPLDFFFYGRRVVTNDLFFSGHTATAFLVYTVLPGKTERRIALALVLILAVLLLAQHIHYTIDVLAAIPFAWVCYRISLRFVTYLMEFRQLSR